MVSFEVEADTEDQAAAEFLSVIEQYLGGIYTERPFTIRARERLQQVERDTL